MKRERLIAARLEKGWSQEQAAEKLGVSWLAVSKWERGQSKPYPVNVRRLCEIYGRSAEELGFWSEDPGMQDRRGFLQTLGALGTVAAFPQLAFNTPLTRSSVESLATITAQYRIMQRNGDLSMSQALSAHLQTIQDALMSTPNDSLRRELWRVLTHTQLISRSTPQNSLAQTKTYIEMAISSSRQCGDTHLQGAGIGHLAHFYLRKEHNPKKMMSILDQAWPLAKEERPLCGWFSLISAAAAAETGNINACESGLGEAMNVSTSLSAEQHDTYYTDFNDVSVNIFAVHCWLVAGKPEKALGFLKEMDFDDLSDNRHASAFCDAAKTYAALDDFDQAECYAIRAVDKAIETHQLHVIPRIKKLAKSIQSIKPRETHALAIAEYVHDAQRRQYN